MTQMTDSAQHDENHSHHADSIGKIFWVFFRLGLTAFGGAVLSVLFL